MAAKKKTQIKQKPASVYKRLYRSEKMRVIAGICGGLSEYFNIDPIIFRLIFILITLFGGGGVIIYLILWIVIPSKSSKNELNEENIKKNVDEIKIKAQELAKTAEGYSHTSGSRKILGIFLLFLGVIFLADNFGLLFPFRYLYKFWPFLLILVALAIIGKKE